MADTVEKNSGRPAVSRREPAVADIRLGERGVDADGQPITLDRRLFMQFMAFGNADWKAVADLAAKHSLQVVVYQDINDPRGIGLMAFHEDPAYFVETVHPVLNHASLSEWQPKPEFTMLGRTYSIGYESDLEDVLFKRPVKRLCDPSIPWAVWYPVRRSGLFERQPREEQRKMLMEHGGIGHAFGRADLAADIRLAGHGLNKDDADFLIGLLGKELFPLSALVQRMRGTRQTSEFIERLGPFFVGRAVWQPDAPDMGC